MVKRFSKAVGSAWSKISGKEKRELRERGKEVLAEHESRTEFGADEAISRLIELMGERAGKQLFSEYSAFQIGKVVRDALDDNLLEPREEASINAVRARYGNPKLDNQSRFLLERARDQYDALTSPLEPVSTPLMLKRGEHCVFGIESEALEERNRTVRVNYGGPSARIRIAKGIYYTAGSIGVQRQTEEFHHSFGSGVLAATNKRLLWVSPSKTIAIPLSRIVMFEPYSDGVKIIKDAGKPIMFVWNDINGVAAVRVGRVIEELR